MKVYNILVKVDIWSNSEYFNSVIWWYVSYLTLVYRLKNQSITDSYNYNNLLVDTQYKNM